VSRARNPFHASAAAFRLQSALTVMAWQAAFVVPLRMQMMATGAASPNADHAQEMTRMVTEKLAAAAEGAGAATVRAMRGGDAVSVAMAAIGPARRKLRANAKRLAKG
jgi:hypothetical protein